MPVQVDGGAETDCLGFVEPKSNAGTRNTFLIERIESCAKLTREPFIEDVLVVWCATREQGNTTVPGWQTQYPHLVHPIGQIHKGIRLWTLYGLVSHGAQGTAFCIPSGGTYQPIPRCELAEYISAGFSPVKRAKRSGPAGPGLSLRYPQKPSAQAAGHRRGPGSGFPWQCGPDGR